MNSSKKYGAAGHYFHSCANKETTDHYSQSRCANKNHNETVSTNHNLFEEKGEPKRYRTKVLPLTNRANPNNGFSPVAGASLSPRSDMSRMKTGMSTDCIAPRPAWLGGSRMSNPKPAMKAGW